jgi:hypothetical protein
MRLCSVDHKIDPQTRTFYEHSIHTLIESGIPFLIGGAYAFGCYTGIRRDTKDLDVFVYPRDANDILDVLSRAGYKTELTDEIWLGKTFHAENLVDVIFSSANGIAMVDEGWFRNSCEAMLLDIQIGLIPPEEMIWSKAFVMTRDRYDGADIMHIIRGLGDELNWSRLVERFGANWRILYNYLILFGFIYPSDRGMIPRWVMDDLAKRLEQEVNSPPPNERICRGTLLSTTQYTVDIEEWDYCDPRPKNSNSSSPRPEAK